MAPQARCHGGPPVPAPDAGSSAPARAAPPPAPPCLVPDRALATSAGHLADRWADGNGRCQTLAFVQLLNVYSQGDIAGTPVHPATGQRVTGALSTQVIKIKVNHGISAAFLWRKCRITPADQGRFR
jgi:hypothetical protein